MGIGGERSGLKRGMGGGGWGWNGIMRANGGGGGGLKRGMGERGNRVRGWPLIRVAGC